MKVKFTKDFPSINGTKSSKEKGTYYPKDCEVDLTLADAQTAIKAGFAVEVKAKK